MLGQGWWVPGLSGVDARLAEAPRWGCSPEGIRGQGVESPSLHLPLDPWDQVSSVCVCVCVCVCVRARARACRRRELPDSISHLVVAGRKWLSQQLSAHPSLGVGASIRIAPNLPVPVAENPAQDLLCLPEALEGGVAGRLSGPDR